jgi:hypothetical protein
MVPGFFNPPKEHKCPRPPSSFLIPIFPGRDGQLKAYRKLKFSTGLEEKLSCRELA